MNKLLFIICLFISGFLFAQDSLKTDFEKFESKISRYENSLDSSFIRYGNSCNKFQLQWIKSIDNLSIETINAKNDRIVFKGFTGKNYCSDLKRFEKLNKKASKKKDNYGLWVFSIKSIGNEYIIVTGKQLTGSIHQQIYYYERIE